jgi:hypothetical protein
VEALFKGAHGRTDGGDVYPLESMRKVALFVCRYARHGRGHDRPTRVGFDLARVDLDAEVREFAGSSPARPRAA